LRQYDQLIDIGDAAKDAIVLVNSSAFEVVLNRCAANDSVGADWAHAQTPARLNFAIHEFLLGITRQNTAMTEAA
jgi:hypothetical protein